MIFHVADRVAGILLLLAVVTPQAHPPSLYLPLNNLVAASERIRTGGNSGTPRRISRFPTSWASFPAPSTICRRNYRT